MCTSSKSTSAGVRPHGRFRFQKVALVLVAAVMALGAGRSAWAADLFVAPNGMATNPGTSDRPLDLVTALSAASPARPGDTIWLLAGTYTGNFRSDLQGTAAAPITVRAYPGARVTLDGGSSPADVLDVYGQWAVFWGLEITNSSLERLSLETGPWPSDLPRGNGVFGWGTNLKFINLVLHDLRSGMGLWSESVGSEVYGSLIYYNGWQGPDGSHGHGIYTQNSLGARLVRDNITFSQFSHGIHAYGSSSAALNNITIEGNVSFNNGILGSSGFERDILLGGGVVAQNPVLRDNATYGGAQSNLGYGAGCSNGTVTNNYLVGSTPLVLVACTPLMTGNVLYNLQAAQWGWAPFRPQDYPANTYYSQRPTTNFVRVRPNLYEAGRGHVVIYNWLRQSYVAVDLTSVGLLPGDDFEVRDAQNFFGPPVVTGVYDGGPVYVPMYGLPLAPPRGNVPVVPEHTADFGVFVVMRRTNSDSALPTASTPTISPAGGTFAGPVTVSISSTTAGALVRYSTDGTVPTATSPVYAGPLVVSSTALVQARASATGMLDSQVASAQFVIPTPVATPTISPAGGTFTGSVTVSIASATTGAELRYTTDGSIPTAGSTLYAGPFIVSATTTVRAVGFATNMLASAVTTTVFTITPQATVVTPVINPAGGTFSGPVTVTLSSPTSGATIRYTTDGSTPTSASAVYVGPFSVSATTTVRAMAAASGMLASTVAAASFTIADAPPGGGTAPSPRVNVALAVNGATAVASSTYSPGYAPSGAINGDRRGYVWGNGGGWNDGTVGAFPDWLEVQFAGARTIDEVDVFSPQDNYSAPSTPTPTMTVGQMGLRDFSVQYWTGSAWQTLPGGAITGNTLVWRELRFSPVTTAKIRVLVTRTADIWSRIAEVEAYTTSGAPNQPPSVAITAPAAGTAITGTSMNLSADATDSDGVSAVAFFADGAAVGAADTTSPFGVTWTAIPPGTHTLTAVATDSLGASTTSAPVTVTVLAAPSVAPPTISPAGGTFSAPVTVSIATAAGATIRYTTDGTTPTSTSSTYAGPFVVSATTTVRAIALVAGRPDSSVTSSAFTITVAPPTSGGGQRVNVALASNGATAAASSTYSPSYGPLGAINGDRTGFVWGNGGGWNDGTAGVFPDWLEVQFAGARTINEVDVFSPQDNYSAPSAPTPTMTVGMMGLRDFTVEYWTGSVWQTLPGGAIAGNTLVWRQLTFAPITTTKIRVLITRTADIWSRIAEIEAYATSGP